MKHKTCPGIMKTETFDNHSDDLLFLRQCITPYHTLAGLTHGPHILSPENSPIAVFSRQINQIVAIKKLTVL